jgi:hypothetical protein
MRTVDPQMLGQLNRYWDRVATGRASQGDEPDDAVRPLAAEVQRLHAEAATATTDLQRVARIWRSIDGQLVPATAPHRRRWCWGGRSAGGASDRARRVPVRLLPRLVMAAALVAVLAVATGAGYIHYTATMVVAQNGPPRPSIYGTPHGTPGPNSAGPVVLAGAVRSGGTTTAPPQVRTFANLATAQAAIPAGNILLGVLYAKTPPGGRALAIYGPDCNETGLPDLSIAGFDRMAEAIDLICPGAMLYQGRDWNPAGGPPQVFFESPNGRNDRLGWFGPKHALWIIASIRFYPYYPIPPYATS